jgi:hypothetical protein
LLREAEHERLLAQLPQPEGGVRSFPVLLKLALRALRVRLQKGFRRRTA